jgi:hypothetical protein
MRTLWKWTVLALVFTGLFGCRSDGRLFPPAGTAQKQRFNATVFDPYADSELGPEVVGARPKDYQKPLSESDKSRLFQKAYSPL